MTLAGDAQLRPVTVVVGDEELLVDRAVAAVVAAARRDDPDAEVRELAAPSLEPGQLAEYVSPSLFGGRRVVVVRDTDLLGKEITAEITAYTADPEPDVALVLVHRGGARNKALLDTLAKTGAARLDRPKITRMGDRLEFVRGEIGGAGRSMTKDAAQALIDAIGNDLRELAAACDQLVADTTGRIDAAVVARYHRGRADVQGFAVADAVVAGRLAEALEQLRWALASGAVTAPMVTGALARSVRSLAKAASAPRGARPADLARDLGVPPWKVDVLRQQARSWTPDGISRALRALAEADALVKGGGVSADYALERAVMKVVAARGTA